MGKVEIFRSPEGWRHRTVGGEASEGAWPRASQALNDAGGSSLESVEILYPEKEGRDTLPEDERVEVEVEAEAEGSEV